MLLQLLSASAAANDGDDALLLQLTRLQPEVLLLLRLVLLTNAIPLQCCHSCTLSLQTVREMLLYTFELKNKKVEPQVRPCVTGAGGLICSSTRFGSCKGSQCNITPDSSILLPVLAGVCYILIAHCLLVHRPLQLGWGNTCLCLQTKKAKVDDLISKLALQSCQNTVIGSPLQRGVSGGEVSL